MNDTIKENLSTGILTFVFIAIIIGTLSWAVLHNETCAICEKEWRSDNTSLIECSNGMKFRVCHDCAWKIFKDKLK